MTPPPTAALPADSVPDPTSPAPAAGVERAWVAGVVAGVRRGDERAFEAMFRAYSAELVAFAESLLGSRDAAQEVVQELFLRIWQQRELWEVAGPLNTYLFRAVRNRAIGELRHRRVEARFRERVTATNSVGAADVVPAPQPLPADGPLRAADLAGAIGRAVAELPDRCREVFRLSRAHRLSNAAIAEVLEISPKTVEVHMTRALSHLRARLADWRAE